MLSAPRFASLSPLLHHTVKRVKRIVTIDHLSQKNISSLQTVNLSNLKVIDITLRLTTYFSTKKIFYSQSINSVFEKKTSAVQCL